MTPSIRSTLALSLLVAAGCDLPKFETTTFTDEGEACLVRAESQPFDDFSGVLEPGDDLDILVFFPVGCLSSSCSDILETTCEASLDGDTINVSSSGRLEQEVDPPVCTSDCGIMTARCPAPDLPAGEYEIVHGDQRTTLTLPGEASCSGI